MADRVGFRVSGGGPPLRPAIIALLRPHPATPAAGDPARARLLATALRLSAFSVAFGAISGGLSVTAGLLDHSLGVLGAGLGVLADLAGSVLLIWRFRSEQRHAPGGAHAEDRAIKVIAATLALIAAVLVAESAQALIAGTHPGASRVALAAAGLALVVLTPLARRKRRTAIALGSEALRGDSTLSAIGAATALLALVGLLLNEAFGWWWADRVVALVVAGVAAAESRALVKSRHPDD